MTPEEREQAKAALRTQIAHYSGIKDDLDECKQKLFEANEAIFDGVSSPMIGYDLSEENKWRGHNYDVAVESVSTIRSTVASYRSTVSSVRSQIALAIKDVEEKIEELEAALAALG